MKVGNVRFGFATNSSSSHSIVRLGRDVINGLNHSRGCGSEFGWDNFTLVTPESKMSYLAQQLYREIDGDLPNEMAVAAIAPFANGVAPDPNGYVDHQSGWSFPRDRKGNLNLHFVRDLEQFLLQDDIVILGGNDNSEGHPLRNDDVEVLSGLPRDGYPPMSMARKDGDWWTMWGPDGLGRKIRFSFKDNPGEYNPKSPLLVDFKITDYCDHGCRHCYQDSGRKGKHGDTESLRQLAWAMAEAEVFEVALGGGEPTAHPDLVNIVEAFHYSKVTVNISTRSLQWLKDPSKFRLLSMLNGVAYSAHYGREIRNFNEAVEFAKRESKRDLDFTPSIHLVMGAQDREETIHMIKVASLFGFPVTMLDFKETGRGEGGSEFEYLETAAEIIENPGLVDWATLGADTPLMAKLASRFPDMTVSDRLYYTEEGLESMYIDGVARKAYKASYLQEEGLNLPAHKRGAKVNIGHWFKKVKDLG